jgi:hypothetical protein
MAAEEAAAKAEADKMAAEEAAAKAEADKMAAEEQLADGDKTIPELEAELAAAMTAHTEAAAAKAAADAALEMATAMRMAAQTAVNDSAPEGLAEAIVALQAAREAETAAEAAAMAAAEVATAAYADVSAAKAALVLADTGPSSEDLVAQAIATAREAFKVLDGLTTIKADDSLSASDTGTGAKFKAGTGTTAFKAAADKTAPSIDGWASAVMTGTRSGGKASANVYSNVAAPKVELFAVVYGGQTTDITDATDDDLTAANWKKSRVATGTTYAGGDTGGAVAGTFDGVAGRFTCSANCPVTAAFPTRRSNGSFLATAVPPGTWTFKATEKDATVNVADTDHLSFGYWLSKSSAGVPTDFSVWYGGGGSKSAVAADTAITALDEAVTYKGAAGGKYVVKDDIVNTAMPGYFTATAELTADFRASQIHANAGADNEAVISGSISDFDAAALGDLTLSLSGHLMYDTTGGANTLNVREDAHNNHDGDDGTTPLEASNTVKAKSGGASHGTVGSWEAQFFGSEKNTNIPTGVAGAFSATVGGQVVVVGGFGADKAAE